jgi:hypothetical protein
MMSMSELVSAIHEKISHGVFDEDLWKQAQEMCTTQTSKTNTVQVATLFIQKLGYALKPQLNKNEYQLSTSQMKSLCTYLWYFRKHLSVMINGDQWFECLLVNTIHSKLPLNNEIMVLCNNLFASLCRSDSTFRDMIFNAYEEKASNSSNVTTTISNTSSPSEVKDVNTTTTTTESVSSQTSVFSPQEIATQLYTCRQIIGRFAQQAIGKFFEKSIILCHGLAVKSRVNVQQNL